MGKTALVILCSGKGERLKEYNFVPKAMIDINGKPFVINIIDQFKEVKDIDVIIFANDDYIIDYFKDSDVRILRGSYSITKSLAKLYEIKDYDNFIICYGDSYADIKIQSMLNSYKDGVVVTTYNMKHDFSFGVVEVVDNVDGEIKVKNFEEKPKIGININIGYINVGSKYTYLFLECDTLEAYFKKLIKYNKLHVYKHTGSYFTFNTVDEIIKLKKDDNFKRVAGYGR